MQSNPFRSDGAGSKLRQDYYISQTTLSKSTDFVSNFVYENGVPMYCTTAEGRIVRKSNGTWFAETYLKDHLGNVRVAFSRESGVTRVKQVNAYYPFGMNIKSLTTTADAVNPNEYLYNGKMMQDEMGLGWLDYGARFYDAQIGRFHTIDNSSEDYYSHTPYNYVGNNPIRRIDPDGNDWVDGVLGFGAAVVDNACGGMTNVRSYAANYVTDASDFNAGLTAGDVTSIAIGGAEISGGAGMVEGGTAAVGVGVVGLAAGGTGSVVIVGGAATAATGAAVATHGAVMMASATKNLAQGKGKLPENKPSSTNTKPANQTSSGKATDQHGNKIGPSGKPQVNTVQHSTQKGAKDAARNEGKGAPVKHTNPKKGGDHYHSTNKSGEKKPNSTHHEY